MKNSWWTFGRMFICNFKERKFWRSSPLIFLDMNVISFNSTLHKLNTSLQFECLDGLTECCPGWNETLGKEYRKQFTHFRLIFYKCHMNKIVVIMSTLVILISLIIYWDFQEKLCIPPLRIVEFPQGNRGKKVEIP